MIFKLLKSTALYTLVLTAGVLTAGLNACKEKPKNTVSNNNTKVQTSAQCSAQIFVLGNGQDAGKPQIGNHDDPAWQNPDMIAPATALGLIAKDGSRYLFDATPDIKAQLFALDHYSGKSGYRLDGIFLTHGHIGHYLGLAQLGREAMGAKNIPVFAMPKMANFLKTNGPWDLLVKLENIRINQLSDGQKVELSEGLHVTPFLVPHRGEYTETVGYHIVGPSKSAIYLPDIDSWEKFDAMDTSIETMIKENDFLFLDGTFYSGDELPGRDMSKIPHPTITHSIERFNALPIGQREKIRFIHLNHSNPAHDKFTNSYEGLEKAGYKIAHTGDLLCLD